MDRKITEIRGISDELNGMTSYGQLNESRTNDLKTPRYMLILYAANDLVFEDLQDKSLENSFTLHSLTKVAKYLRLHFDRSKTGRKKYEEQMEKKLVVIVKTDVKAGYKLSKKGCKYCEEILSHLVPSLKDSFNNNPDIELYTKKWDEENTKNTKHVQTLSPEEFQKWHNANPGKLFRQPTENEALIEKMFKKFEELEQKYN